MASKTRRGRLGWLWTPLDKVDWFSIAKVANSFVGRALSGLSLASLFLVNFSDLLHQNGVSAASLERIYIGSLLFLIGVAVYAIRIPAQVSTGPDVVAIVSRLRLLTDWQFFESQRKMAKGAYERLSAKIPYVPTGTLTLLETRISAAGAINEDDGWTDKIAGLYQAHLQALRYDRPISRFFAAAFLLAGAGTLFCPVAQRIVDAASKII